LTEYRYRHVTNRIRLVQLQNKTFLKKANSLPLLLTECLETSCHEQYTDQEFTMQIQLITFHV